MYTYLIRYIFVFYIQFYLEVVLEKRAKFVLYIFFYFCLNWNAGTGEFFRTGRWNIKGYNLCGISSIWYFAIYFYSNHSVSYLVFFFVCVCVYFFIYIFNNSTFQPNVGSIYIQKRICRKKNWNFLPDFFFQFNVMGSETHIFDIEIIQKIITLRLVPSMIIRCRYFFSQPIFFDYGCCCFFFSIR